ncbi:acetolactate synthase 3 large subunit [Kushneria phosphatilytica]|uniref:Acetolactate synthase n=1 Tax=Kushneria phosphatilytica TaxID=657387 RepID=A0A1S1NZS4_9GAMM|nr:acetolactate synthase 3 large subunit [Kushneria phosphatilytica]OHV11482.1 acetolactate synthase, large subunit, biosynthetic type [Kushneria phosphatilytica]QEL12075.1 acetolactate synthase 3 large subunit [Kushneria phosphatilytica]
MELLSGADMIARFLKDEGVEYIYGYPGGAALHIYDALFRQEDVKHILVRHEQAATHMADGYARASGKPGVVLVTSGPGATNAVTGIATAYMDSIPMVVLCGQVASHLIGEDAFQETDIVGVTRPIVKHSFSIRHPSEIPTVMRKAFYLAATGRPGPVVIDIPKDMTAPTERYEYVYPKKAKIRSYNPVTRGHTGQIRKAVDMLLKSQRPVLFAGGGVITGRASEALTDLARRLNIPVITSLMGIGAYPQNDRQSLGWPGMHGSYESNMAMHESDLVVGIGVRFDDRVTNNVSKFCPGARIVHIDVDPSSISKTVRADIPIVGAADSVLNEMLGMLSEREQENREALDAWWERIDGWRAERQGKLYEPSSPGEPLKPQQVIEAVHRVTNGDAYVVTDVGQHQMFAAQYYKFNQPNHWISSSGLGTMGYGFPAAMGIKLSYPEEHVVLFTGEGSFQMMMQELSTCKQFGIAVKIVNLNNASLGMVRQWQDLNYKSRHAHSYVESMPDFEKLLDAYGFRAITVNTAEELDAALDAAFSSKDELVFLDVHVDPYEHVYPMQVPQGAMRDMLLSKTERT